MDHDHHPDNESRFRWRSPGGIVLLCFLAIAGFFLLVEHRAHVYGLLPYILLALCPLLHLFGHHGHGHHDHDSPKTPEKKP